MSVVHLAAETDALVGSGDPQATRVDRELGIDEVVADAERHPRTDVEAERDGVEGRDRSSRRRVRFAPRNPVRSMGDRARVLERGHGHLAAHEREPAPAAVVAVGFSVTCMSASSVAFTPSDGAT